MLTLLLTTQVIIATAPPLPPAQAVAVLQGSRSVLDRTHAFPLQALPDNWFPTASTQQWKPGSGYFPPQQFRPLGVLEVPGIVYRLPRAARVEHRPADNRSGRTR